MMSCKDCPYYKDTDEIRKETTFVYDGNNYKFHLDDYTREFGYLLTRFHIITSIESAKKFIGIKQFFDGILLYTNIPVKCYVADFKRCDMLLDKFQITIVGEEKRADKTGESGCKEI